MSAEKKYRDAFNPAYRDKYGLICENPYGEPGGNGLLFLAHYYDQLRRRGYLNEDDKAEFRRIVASCWVKPGLLKRHPDHPAQLGPDDYIGVTHAASFMAPEIAKQVLDYGRSHGYIYKNTSWKDFTGTYSAIMWKPAHIHVIAHIHHAAGEEAGSPWTCAFKTAVSWAAKARKEYHDNWILMGHMVDTYYRFKKGQIGPECERFLEKFNQHYPNGYPELYRAYFKNKDHPLGILV